MNESQEKCHDQTTCVSKNSLNWGRQMVFILDPRWASSRIQEWATQRIPKQPEVEDREMPSLPIPAIPHNTMQVWRKAQVYSNMQLRLSYLLTLELEVIGVKGGKRNWIFWKERFQNLHERRSHVKYTRAGGQLLQYWCWNKFDSHVLPPSHVSLLLLPSHQHVCVVCLQQLR